MDILRSLLKKLPLDLGQKEYRLKTKGSAIAVALAGEGRGRKAVDLGCGEGFWTERLKQNGWNVIGVDIAPHYPGATTHDLNNRIPFPDASVDLVFSLATIAYITDTKQFIAEIRRVLRANGRYIITTPNKNMLFLGRIFEKLQDQAQQHYFTEANIRRFFPGGQIYGYFPYALVKRRIAKYAGLLSPTFIVTGTKENLL